MSSSPSLAGRAIAAVSLTVCFYALALLIGLGLIAAPIALFAVNGRGNVFVAFAMIVAGVTILRAIVPPRDRFVAPGPALDAATQPKLHEALCSVADAVGEPVPAEVYLDPEVNAAVTEVGNGLGRGRRRVMLLGLPLLAALRPDELKAVIAHEYGHYIGGDTRFAAWIWRTRVAVLRTVAALDNDDSWFQRVIVRTPFLLYAKGFMRLTNAISRRQEFAADAVSARVAGAEAAAAALRRVTAAAPAYGGYWQEDVAFALQHGRRPPIVAGFQSFLADHEIRAALDELVAGDLEASGADPYDSHPTLAERLRALGAEETGDVGTANPDEVATTLLSDIDGLEAALLRVQFGDGIGNLEPMGWDEAGALHVREARETAEGFAPIVAPERTVGDAATLIADVEPLRPAVTTRLGSESVGAGEQDVDGFSRYAIVAAVIAALDRAGWSARAAPGEALVLARGDVQLQPFAELQGAATGDDGVERAWRARCAEAGIAELALAPDAFSGVH